MGAKKSDEGTKFGDSGKKLNDSGKKSDSGKKTSRSPTSSQTHSTQTEKPVEKSAIKGLMKKVKRVLTVKKEKDAKERKPHEPSALPKGTLSKVTHRLSMSSSNGRLSTPAPTRVVPHPLTPARSESNEQLQFSFKVPMSPGSNRGDAETKSQGSDGGVEKKRSTVSRALGFLTHAGIKSPTPSQGSTNVTQPKSVDESMSREKLLIQVRLLRRELSQRDNYIAQLEDYRNMLLEKVLTNCPELLEKSPPASTRRESRSRSKSLGH